MIYGGYTTVVPAIDKSIDTYSNTLPVGGINLS